MPIRRKLSAWDAWGVPASFIAFGVLNARTTLASLNQFTAGTFLIVLNLEFVVAGILMAIGMWKGYPRVKRIGHLVAAAGLIFVGIAILVAARLRGAPVAALLFGFAFREVGTVMAEAREEREFQALMKVAMEGEDGPQ